MDVPDGDNLATCESFKTDWKSLAAGETIGNPDPGRFSILSVVEGALLSAAGRHFDMDQFILFPSNAAPLQATCDSTILQVTLP
jgi:mannose-6-phosphate isomerase